MRVSPLFFRMQGEPLIAARHLVSCFAYSTRSARRALAVLRVYLALDHEVVFDVTHQTLQRVDRMGANVGADEHVHE